MTARKRKPPAAPTPPPTRTRFKVSLTFEFEAEGNFGLPPWISDKYRSFIIGALQQQKLSVPVFLVPGSKCKAYLVDGAKHARASGSKCFFTGGEWSDRGETKSLRIFGEDLTVIAADGEALP